MVTFVHWIFEDVLTRCFIFGSSTKIDTARSRFSGPLPLEAVSPDVRPTCTAARDLAVHVRDEQEGVLDGAALVLRDAPDPARSSESSRPSGSASLMWRRHSDLSDLGGIGDADDGVLKKEGELAIANKKFVPIDDARSSSRSAGGQVACACADCVRDAHEVALRQRASSSQGFSWLNASWLSAKWEDGEFLHVECRTSPPL